jgi:hypothetical protein
MGILVTNYLAASTDPSYLSDFQTTASEVIRSLNNIKNEELDRQKTGAPFEWI